MIFIGFILGVLFMALLRTILYKLNKIALKRGIDRLEEQYKIIFDGE